MVSDFLEKCPFFIEASSLALEPWMGTAFVLAAHLPPKAKKEGTVGGAFYRGYLRGRWFRVCPEENRA